jgi:glycosyltransferase involved in cell wall biosynthesis
MLRKVPISVIITCYNLEKFLPECVESIYAQTMPPHEMIIVHDGCKDLSQCYQRATNILRTSHKGVARTRDEGVLLSTGEHILFVDADDCLEEYFIEAMVNKKLESKADIIYPNVFLWSRWHKDIKLKNGWHESDAEITMENMLERNRVVITSLIPRRVYGALGGIADLPILEDWDFFLKALKAEYTFAKAPTAILRYRQRAEGRNRQSDELKNQFYYEIRGKYEKVSGT